jgi:hypothetical protein
MPCSVRASAVFVVVCFLDPDCTQLCTFVLCHHIQIAYCHIGISQGLTCILPYTGHIVGGQFYIMDYGLVCQPITSLAIYLRTSQLYHCTLYLDKEASEKGAVQAGCSVFTSTSSIKAVAPLVEEAIELAPYRRQVAHVIGNLLRQHMLKLGQDQAWANSLAADRIEGQQLSVPASFLGGKAGQEVVGTIGLLVPLHEDQVPPGAFSFGGDYYETLGAYREAMEVLQPEALQADKLAVGVHSLPEEFGDVLVQFKVPGQAVHKHIPFSQLMRLHAKGEAKLLGKGSTVQDVYEAANNPLRLL